MSNKNVYIDFKRLYDAVKHWLKYYKPKEFESKSFLASKGIDRFLHYKIRDCSKDNTKSMNFRNIQKIIELCNLVPEHFIYFAEKERVKSTKFNTRSDFYNPKNDDIEKNVTINKISKKSKKYHLVELLGNTLATFDLASIPNFKTLDLLASHIALLFKEKFPNINVNKIVPISLSKDEKEKQIKIVCNILDDLNLTFILKLGSHLKDAMICVNVENKIINEDFLSDKAFIKLTHKVIINYLTIFKSI